MVSGFCPLACHRMPVLLSGPGWVVRDMDLNKDHIPGAAPKPTSLARGNLREGPRPAQNGARPVPLSSKSFRIEPRFSGLHLIATRRWPG